jgi:hypothetical protein
MREHANPAKESLNLPALDANTRGLRPLSSLIR